MPNPLGILLAHTTDKLLTVYKDLITLLLYKGKIYEFSLSRKKQAKH